MPIEYREFAIGDYEAAVELWSAADGVVLRDADSRAGIARYLVRNPGLSFVATDGSRVVGTVLCGHDGRRGYLQHLTVALDCRRRGIGRRLVGRALTALHNVGIQKCHLMVLPSNHAARAFWRSLGWVERSDVVLMSHTPDSAPNA